MITVEIELNSGWLTIGEAGVQGETGNILPLLKEVSEITRAINPDKSFENSRAYIKFHNSDYYWTRLMESGDQYIKENLIRIKDGGELIFEGKIYDTPRCPANEFHIEADLLSYGFEDSINPSIGKSEFPEVPDENSGKVSNIIGGIASDSGGNNSGILTARRTGPNKYLAARHHLYSFNSPLDGVEVFDKDENEITTSCSFENDIATENAFINYVSEDLEINFNSKGMIDDQGDLIDNPGEIFREILSRFSDFQLDEASFSAAIDIFNSRNYTGSAIIINDEISWREHFRLFSINFDCFVFQKVDGKLALKALDWGTEEVNHTIKNIFVNTKTFERWVDIKKIINELKRMYWYHYRKHFFHYTPQDVEAETGWKAKGDKIDLRYIRDDLTARDVAARTIFVGKNKLICYSFEVSKSIGNSIELADVCNFQFFNHYEVEFWRMILTMRKTYRYGSQYVKFEAIDITDINQNTVILWAESDDRCHELTDEGNPQCPVLL